MANPHRGVAAAPPPSSARRAAQGPPFATFPGLSPTVRHQLGSFAINLASLQEVSRVTQFDGASLSLSELDRHRCGSPTHIK
jgi:hypothetical protein